MPIIILLLVIIHAYLDSQRIKQGKSVNHWVEGLFYAAAVVVVYYMAEWFGSGVHWAWAASIGLTVRAAIFDPALNGFRGLPLVYNGTQSSTRSIIDTLEDKLNLPHGGMMAIYVGVAIVNVALFYWLA